MSVLTEYIRVIRNGIANGDKVIQALIVGAQVKNGKISEEALAEILRRKEICGGCIFNSKNAKAAGIYNSSIAYEHCIHCICRLGGDDTKEYCLSCTCGISEWNRLHPDKPMEEKWGPFDVSKEQ